ncbi:hypothetical protein [Planctomonas deserti]|uniref:hypothetical protein n=1 Tax=Planctomonas deserti TaxID=2144185 RepID=UPI00131ED2FB|nr:hypothetical protein [Planctomonas deserti]
MPTTPHPVGRQSAAVYRRRRIVVGLALLLVILVIALIVGRLASSSGAENDPADPSASTASEPAASGDPDPAETDAADADDVTIEECDPALLEVVALTDAEEYEPDAQPKLSFSITNTGSDVCTANVGTSTQVYTISTGADVVWTSTDCQEDPTDQLLTLEPNTPVSSTPFAWERVRSSEDTCDVEEREAVIGEGATYALEVEAAGSPSLEPRTFLLY